MISVKVLLAIAVSVFGPVMFSAEHEEPLIRNRTLTLTKAQREAVRVYNPAFQLRKLSDYLPTLVKQYRFSGHQLPFAVIGDFNGDGRKDVVLQGHDRKNELLIAILSVSNGPRVMEIRRFELIDPKTEYYGMGDHTEYGLWGYLTFVPKGTINSPYEKHPLKLTADAFEANAFEKAAVLYYLRGNKFDTYITGD